MPFANNKGVKIHYEVEGKGPPLIMAHGVTRSLSRWRQNGFADALKRDHRLVLFDARGHGTSDKPHDPAAYGINMVADVLAVLDAARIERADYMGYSMGAGIGFACAVHHAQRFNSLILGGWNPYRSAAPAGSPTQSEPSSNDPEAFIRMRERMLGRPMTPDERKEALTNDPAAITALMVTFRDVASFSNKQLSRISAPCLLYAGTADAMHAGAHEASQHIPNARFFSLPGFDHVQTGSSLDILPNVIEFFAAISRN